MLEDYVVNGKTLKRWLYYIEMVPSGASTEVAIYHKGQKVASQNVAIKFQ